MSRKGINLTKSSSWWLRSLDILYTPTCPSHESHLARSVDAAQTLLIHGTKYFTSNAGWLKFKHVTSYHVGFDTMSKHYLNQKFKLMVVTLRYVIYSNKVCD